MAYDSIPAHYARDDDAFRAVYAKALRGTARVLYFGDSRATIASRLATYINLWLAQTFGNAPESIVGQVNGNYGNGPGADSPAGWLIRGSAAGVSASRVATTKTLPGLLGASSIEGNLGNVNTCLYDGSLTHDPSIAPGNYFKGTGASDTCTMDIIAATNASSGEVFYDIRPRSDFAVSFYDGGNQVATGTTSLGLESGTFAFKKASITCPFASGRPYQLVKARGSDAVKYTDILGVRFRSDTSAIGAVSNHCTSSGGYTSASFLTNHADSWDLLNLIGCDVAILHYGANDCLSGVTQANMETNLDALITAIRANLGTQIPIVLVGDVYRTGLSQGVGSEQEKLDSYPDACYTVAQATRETKFVNLRLLAEQAGWTAAVENPQGVTDRGAWDVGTAYAVNDTVTYGTQTYKCVTAHTGKTPHNHPDYYTVYWQLNKPNMRDGVHWTNEGARRVASTLMPLIFKPNNNEPRYTATLMRGRLR